MTPTHVLANGFSMKWFFYINPCIFSICKILQQNLNNENENVVTNGKGGNKNAKIHCQNGHGNGKTSNLRYLQNQFQMATFFVDVFKYKTIKNQLTNYKMCAKKTFWQYFQIHKINKTF